MLKKYIYYIIPLILIIIIFLVLNEQLFKTKIVQTTEKPISSVTDEITIQNIESEFLKKANSVQKEYYKKELEKKDYKNIQIFWIDTMKISLPFFYYLGQEGVILKKEKQIIEAGKFFYENIKRIEKKEFKKWFALQSKYFFQEALNINSKNDSTKVYLGATILFGEIEESPMQAISMLKNVVDKDSTFMFAQKMLGYASYFSGQFDKAIYRLSKVKKQNPLDLENLLLLAESFENLKQKTEAKEIYLEIKKISKNQSEEFKNQLISKINSLK